MIVIPAEGALVRDPMTRLALEGETEVDLNEPYWARLVADGDLIEPEPAAPVRAAPPTRQTPSSEDAA